MQSVFPNLFDIGELEQHVALDTIIIVLDINFNIIHLNPLGEKIFGWPSACVINKNFVALCEDSDIVAPIPRNLLKILHDKAYYKISMSVTNRFGEESQIAWHAAFTYNKQGQQSIGLRGEVVSYGDKRASSTKNVDNLFYIKNKQHYPEEQGLHLAEHNTYEAINEIIRFLPGCSYMKDVNGRYLGGNDYLAKSISGVPKIADIIGHDDKYLADIIGSRWPDEYYLSIRRDDLQVIEKQHPLINKIEPAFLDSNGHVVMQLSTKMPLYSERKKVIGIFGISLDVSNQLSPLNLWTLYNQLYHDKNLMHEKLLSYILMNNGSKKIALLSHKELECLIYLSIGKTAKEIAKINGLSFRTIEKHIENIKEKSDCHSRSELVRLLHYGVYE